jgi:hypothetical protein
MTLAFDAAAATGRALLALGECLEQVPGPVAPPKDS